MYQLLDASKSHSHATEVPQILPILLLQRTNPVVIIGGMVVSQHLNGYQCCVIHGTE